MNCSRAVGAVGGVRGRLAFVGFLACSGCGSSGPDGAGAAVGTPDGSGAAGEVDAGAGTMDGTSGSTPTGSDGAPNGMPATEAGAGTADTGAPAPADAASGANDAPATGSSAEAGTSTDAGTSADGGLADGSAPFVCNQVTGLTLTREWYEAGFENGVDNARWQLKAMEHAYVTEWANPASTFWSTPIESACSQNSTSPDRLVFVVLSWTITAQADWETQITAAINNFKTNYPMVRRIDLLTVIRGPANMLCPTPPAAGETIQMPAALDAAFVSVAAQFPGLVFVGPKVEATSCADFNGGGPHLTTAGNMKAASTYAAYFATH